MATQKCQNNSDLKILKSKISNYLTDLGRETNIFHLKAKKAVFLAVDMQNFVCEPEPGRELPQIKRVMERINLLADFCHEHEIPVIWLKQKFTQKNQVNDVGLYGLFHKQPLDPGMFNQGEACKIHESMHFSPNLDFKVKKNRYSAFAPGSSCLEALLADQKRTQLILSGAATNVCVESTARDAMQRGYQVTVLSDATTAFDKLVHEISLLNIKLFFGDTKSTDEVMNELRASL